MKIFKYIVMIIVSLMTLSLFASLKIPSIDQPRVVGASIKDIYLYLPSNIIPDAKSLRKKISKSVKRLSHLEVYKIFGHFPTTTPLIQKNKVLIRVVTFIKDKSGDFYFLKSEINYNKTSKRLEEVNIRLIEIIPLEDTFFKLSVGLIDRKLIMKDENSDIKLVFPIGVGGFDLKVIDYNMPNLLTLRLKSGFISKRLSYARRTKPRYYKGKPFIRIVRSTDISKSKNVTAIGFHIRQNNNLVRGFDSHGCIRMRETDLAILFNILNKGDKDFLPLKMLYRLDDEIDHPYPKLHKGYQTVKNYGTLEEPVCKRERTGWFGWRSPPLVVLKYVYKKPPVEMLDDSNDLLYPEDERRKCASLNKDNLAYLERL